MAIALADGGPAVPFSETNRYEPSFALAQGRRLETRSEVRQMLQLKRIRLFVVALVPVALAVLLVGCAAPKFKAESFVGTWVRPAEGGAAYPFKLELVGNGTGVTSGPFDPHPVTIKWYLRRDKLVIAPETGGVPYDYTPKFDGPDELTLTDKDGNQLTVTREAST